MPSYTYVSPQVKFLLEEKTAKEWNYYIKRSLAALGYSSKAAFLEQLFLLLIEAGRRQQVEDIIAEVENGFNAIISAARDKASINKHKVWVIDRRHRGDGHA